MREYFTEREIELLQSMVSKKLLDGSIIYFNNGEFHLIPPGLDKQVLMMYNGVPQWGNINN